MFKFVKYFTIISLFSSFLSAQVIDGFSDNQNILAKSEIYIDSNNLSLREIKMIDRFQSNHLEHFNIGFVRDKSVWIKITINNITDKNISRVLVVKNPLLEKVVLYAGNKKSVRGMLHVEKKQTTLNPSFEISIAPNRSCIYYVNIINKTTALQFDLLLKSKETFLYDEYTQEALIMIFLGIIVAILIYSLFLYLFTRSKAYMYYVFYLSALVFVQLTYLGITPLIFCKTFVSIDNLMVVLKVNIMYIMAAIFAQSFLQTINYPTLNKIYRYIIIIALVEIPIFGTQSFYYPEIAVLSGFVFVIYNIFAGVYIYLDGYKQARFFVAGWSIVAIGFILMIVDSLGLVSVMYRFPNLIMYSIALEALILSFAFTDSAIILTKEKERSDKKLLENMQNSKRVIEKEILLQTKELTNALENKKTILNELQHRTKNHLQLIVSLVRMQADRSEHVVKEKFQQLEWRIRAIAKTHEVLYFKDDLQQINMNEYIDELCSGIEDANDGKDIRFMLEIREIYMPFREAGYVGLIINELVTNSIKYAGTGAIVIVIEMNKDNNNYLLEIRDNGIGYEFKTDKSQGMGITLVKTLVQSQLDGSLKVENKNGMIYLIEYKI